MTNYLLNEFSVRVLQSQLGRKQIAELWNLLYLWLDSWHPVSHLIPSCLADFISFPLCSSPSHWNPMIYVMGQRHLTVTLLRFYRIWETLFKTWGSVSSKQRKQQTNKVANEHQPKQSCSAAFAGTVWKPSVSFGTHTAPFSLPSHPGVWVSPRQERAVA